MRKKTLLATVAALLAFLGVMTHEKFDLLGALLRATADETVSHFADSLPDDVQDRERENSLADARQEMVKHHAQQTMSKVDLTQLATEIGKLEASIARRARLLKEACPVLNVALRGQPEKIRFAGSELSLPDLKREIDELLTLQSREERQLATKREGLQRLQRSERESEEAIVEWRRNIEAADEEIAILKNRRQHAQIERRALDMLAVVTKEPGFGPGTLNESLNRFRSQVAQLEAENDARRDLAPATDRERVNELSSGWDRMEALKRIAETQQPVSPSVPAERPVAEPTKPPMPLSATEVRIQIRNRDADSDAKK